MNELGGFNMINFFSGGLAGSLFTILYSKHKNKVQKMKCINVVDNAISTIPIQKESEEYDNIHSKEFYLKNTTNIDIKSFKIIFEFDDSSKIIKNSTMCKSGRNKAKIKKNKPNEVVFTVKDFGRNDNIRFFIDVANVTKNQLNITESGCLGFKIKAKVKLRKIIPKKSVVVEKEMLSM